MKDKTEQEASDAKHQPKPTEGGADSGIAYDNSIIKQTTDT
jgi:hypothetical protein